MKIQRNRSRGFTLIETLVVISVIGILLSLLLPAIQHVRDSSDRLQCQNQLKQIALGLTAYEATHGRLAPAGTDVAARKLFWSARILPMLEQSAVWLAAEEALKIEPMPYKNPPHVGMITPIPTYHCPADGRLSKPQTTARKVMVALCTRNGGETDIDE